MIWAVFNIIQKINAQTPPTGFSVYTWGNHIFSWYNYWTIILSWNTIISDFNRTRRNNWWTQINLPVLGTDTIYFNNFDTPEVLEQNQVPLADSIRDFPNENFTWWTIGTGNNGWSYVYKYNSQTQITQYCDSTYTHICFSCDPWTFTPYCNNTFLTWFTSSTDETSLIQECEFGYTVCEECDWSLWDCILPYDQQVRNFFPKAYAEPIGWFVWYSCITYWPWEEAACELRTLQAGISLYNKLTYNLWTNLRTIWTSPIITYNFANIGKKYAHPGSGTITSSIELSWLNNIPVIRQRTSNLTGKIKIINTLSDDENNCGSWIKYSIYTGTLDWTTLTWKRVITGYILPNLFPKFTIEKEVNVKYWDNIFFEIDNNGNNECDGTRNWIQIYDITSNTGVTWPSFSNNGKYWGALEFSWNQRYSLGEWYNQDNEITIAARINTRNNNQSQGIITKKFAYGMVLKQGTLRISPSTYWMRHDTGIPINSNERTHVARTYDGSTMRAYKNWSQVRTYNVNWTLSGNENLAMIGYDELNNRWRNGYIDEFRMYNVAFSTGQINELYQSNLKNNWSWWVFTISKTGLLDNQYFFTGNATTGTTTNTLEWSILIDTKGPILQNTNLFANESNNLSISICWFDTWMSVMGYIPQGTCNEWPIRWQTYWTWFKRWYWRDLNWDRDIPPYPIAENSRSFGIEDEPTIKKIKVQLTDYLGNISYRTGEITRRNTAPIAIGHKSLVTGFVEKKISFSASWYDTWSSVIYQRYTGSWCTNANTISWHTYETFEVINNSIGQKHYSYGIFDNQWERNCKDITFEWLAPEFNMGAFNQEGNTGINLNGNPTWSTEISWTIIQQGTIGNCQNQWATITYTSSNIGNDFCVISSWWQQIVIGRYGINQYLTQFNLSWTKGSLWGQEYAITDTSNPFTITIKNNNLTGFDRNISWKNNTITVNTPIYSENLIWLYNFDKILLTDSESDFSAIQDGKNRSYRRRPRWNTEFSGLQYNAVSKQRIISTPTQTFDWLFIDKNQINPWDNYGEAVLWRKSPINGRIEIQYELLDANTTCGDGIQYVLTKNNITSNTGSDYRLLRYWGFENKSLITKIQKDEYIFLQINSMDNNECDNTKYNIKIYQLPESNLWYQWTYQWTNSGATYTSSGKYYGALTFDGNSMVNLGTWIWSSNMSISMRVLRNVEDQNQSIIQKRWSYGIAIINNTLQVTNKTDNRRYDTNIAIPLHTRTHIGRSYDGTSMKVYINGKESWTTTILGSVQQTSNPTYVWYSIFDGQRKGNIDEIYIYDRAITNWDFANLYQHNLNKISANTWIFTSNQSWAIYDGKFNFSAKVNWSHEKNGSFMRDFNWPELQSFLWFSGNEETDLYIKTERYDYWTEWIPSFWFDRDINGDDIFEYTNTGKNITIPAQNEPSTKTIKIKIKDSFWHITMWSWKILRINTKPVLQEQTLYKSKINGNINFDAKITDSWANLNYQWYHWSDCITQIIWATDKFFITGSNSIYTGIFSYKARDSQGSGSDCWVVTWIRNTWTLESILYMTGNGEGWSITETLPSWYTTGKVIQQAKKWVCTINNSTISYIPNTRAKWNDSCIIEDSSTTEKFVIAIKNINTATLLFWTGDMINSWIITDRNYLSQDIKILSPSLTSITWTVDINNNLIWFYNFDKIKIADSESDFSIFQGENWWKYYHGNTNDENLLQYNIEKQYRMIEEPLQDFEYVTTTKDTTYPWSIRYGDTIYERTSTFSGNIIIENTLSDADNQCWDGINISIKKDNELLASNDLDYNFWSNGTTTTTNIYLGQKIFFFVNSKSNNQCDKIRFSAKIFTDPNNGLFQEQKSINIHWNPIRWEGKNNGGYTLNDNNQYFVLWTINSNINTGPSFSMWIKTTDTNGTIIYKDGSYGLVIKDGKIQATTDGYRRYDTTITTETLQNRTHLTRTYDTKRMKIYINGKEYRSWNINGYYPINSNTTTLGRSSSFGQREWSIDEIRIYNKLLSTEEVEKNYNTSIIRKNLEEWMFTYNQTNLNDWMIQFTWYINNILITGQKIIDTKWPLLSFLTTSGEENQDLIITLSWNDLWTHISWFSYRYKTSLWSNWSDWKKWIWQWWWNSITISWYHEPSTGIIEMELRDLSNNTSNYSTWIFWNNVKITTTATIATGNEWDLLYFFAEGNDPGGTTNTGYQRFLGDNCTWSAISSEKVFSTGRNEPTISVFSYTMIDKQGLSGTCSIATGIRENITPTTQNISVYNNGNVYITFTGNAQDPGGTTFWYIRYNDDSCQNSITNQTGSLFTTGSEKAITKAFSYKVNDPQGLSSNCSIATGYWPHINPIAHDFFISQNTKNETITGNRRDWSEARDSEFNTQINANISYQSWWICRLTNDIIWFQPLGNIAGTGFCELKLTDNNNGITFIKTFATNIDTTAPQTEITGENNIFTLKYTDSSNTTWTTFYKILTGSWETSACGINDFITYWGTNIILTYSTGINNYKTICYYSKDDYGNTESMKSKVFNKNNEKLTVTVNSPLYAKDSYSATIFVNKPCFWTLTGLYEDKTLTFNQAWTYTITWSFTETNWTKYISIKLQTNNEEDWIFSWIYNYTIDQIVPTTPIITETLHYNDYYSVKRNSSNDQWAWLLAYNYMISYEWSPIKNWTTDTTYLNIFKSDIQNYNTISIKIQAKDKVNNVSERSIPTSITITPTQTTSDTIPNQFSFSKTTSAKLNTTYTSNEIVISGLTPNTSIPINASTGSLYINNTQATNNSGLVKNGDIVYVKLKSSTTYNEITQTTISANGIYAIYSVTTESKVTSNISFIDELKKILEQLKEQDETNSWNTSTTNTGIDTKWISAPYTAPNGKIYNLYRTVDWRYSAYNFIYKRYFSSLTELKQYINKNNPR